MTTINLYQNKEESKLKGISQKGNGGFFFSISILVLTLIVLFGLKFYIPIAEKKNEALTAIVNTENSKLVGLKNLEQIVDMQKRLSEIKNNLQIKDGAVSRTEMTKVLDKISLEMNKGVIISNYEYSDGNINATFSAGNFSDVSRQIYNFKKSSNFSEVNLSRISRGEKDILFEIEMKFKG